jgi:SdpI/YhfL family protein
VSAYDRVVVVVSLVLLIVGVGIAVLGLLGFRERLPRNRFAGVRTAATLRDERAFRVANKVAGLPFAVAGAVAAVSGIIALNTGLLVVVIVGLAGLAGITIAGGIAGQRAAERVPEEKRELPEGCKGCQCGGCDLARSVGADVPRVRGE